VKENNGFVLLKSLLTIAVLLICVAAFYASLATAVKQSGYFEKRLLNELSLRKEKIMGRIK
jgi:hypothetical protein